MTARIFLALLLAASASPGAAGEAGIRPWAGDSLANRPPAGGRDLRVEVSAAYKTLSGESDFVIASGAQANHVAGGDRAHKVATKRGEGLEYKKWGFIVNTLPVEDPADPKQVLVQIQLELSGPVEGKDGVDIESWQLQTQFTVEKGKWNTLAAKPAKVRIRVRDAGSD